MESHLNNCLEQSHFYPSLLTHLGYTRVEVPFCCIKPLRFRGSLVIAPNTTLTITTLQRSFPNEKEPYLCKCTQENPAPKCETKHLDLPRMGAESKAKIWGMVNRCIHFYFLYITSIVNTKQKSDTDEMIYRRKHKAFI
jgi:hypothetical protein